MFLDIWRKEKRDCNQEEVNQSMETNILMIQMSESAEKSLRQTHKKDENSSKEC